MLSRNRPGSTPSSTDPPVSSEGAIADARSRLRPARYWPVSRRGIDAVHVVLGVAMVLVGAWVARQADPTIFEINAFRLINELPAAFGPPLLGIMQLGALPAVALFGAVALLGRRPRLARYLVVGGFAAWALAKLVQVLVDEEPPDIILPHVVLHGSVAPGLAFPATHVAVAAAMATIAGPYFSRPNRRLAWWLVAAVGVARIYVGAHFPIDVLGGIGVGWAVGSLQHLLVGSPGSLPSRTALCSALGENQSCDDMIPLPCATGSRGASRQYRVAGPTPLAAKLVGRDDTSADWLYRAWRLLVFRRDDERQRLRAPRELAEHEAYLLLLAQQAGVRVPGHIRTVPVGEEHALLVREHIDGHRLGSLSPGAVCESALVRAWDQLHRLHAAGISVGSPALEAFVVDEHGDVSVVDLAGGSTGGDVHRFARDDAELCLAIAACYGVDPATRCAAEALGPAGLSDLLGQLQPLSLSPRNRRAGRRDQLLARLRRAIAAVAGTELPRVSSPTTVAARNLLPLLGALFAVNLLLPQVGQAHATLDALGQARWPWLLVVAVAAAGTYVAAAVSLMGAVGRRLELGRTTAAQLAAAFTNRLAPAGVGGMTTNVQYLRATGSTKTEAVTAVGLNSIGGFIVHLVGLAAIVPLLGAGHTRLRFSGPDLPERWPYLVLVLAVLVGAGLVRWWAIVRRSISRAIRGALTAVAGTVRKPRAALALLGGAAGITAGYMLALAAASQAFGVGLPLTAIAAVYLGGSAVAAATPAPGGLGALEAALVAGLTAAGASAGPAIAAVLVYRLLTYWLPVLPGALTYHALRRAGSL